MFIFFSGCWGSFKTASISGNLLPGFDKKNSRPAVKVTMPHPIGIKTCICHEYIVDPYMVVLSNFWPLSRSDRISKAFALDLNRREIASMKNPKRMFLAIH